jgi:hypothetical protein
MQMAPPGFIDDYWFAEPDGDDETCGPITVCIRTAKVPRGAHLCILVPGWCAYQRLCRAEPRRGRTAKKHARHSFPHGNESPHGKEVRRTVEVATHDKGERHGRGGRAHDKVLGARQRLCRAISARHTAKEGFAGFAGFAVPTSPHGKARLSSSEANQQRSALAPHHCIYKCELS